MLKYRSRLSPNEAVYDMIMSHVTSKIIWSDPIPTAVRLVIKYGKSTADVSKFRSKKSGWSAISYYES